MSPLPILSLHTSQPSHSTASHSYGTQSTSHFNIAIFHVLSLLKFSHIVDRHGDSVLTPLKALIQHICTKLPDRAEHRNRLATVVSKLLSLFSNQLYSELLEWIYKFSRNTKVGYRVFALDIVSELLTKPLRQPKEG